MNRAFLSTRLLILAVTLNAVIGQLVLKRAVMILGGPVSLADLPRFIGQAVRSPCVYGSLAVQAFGYLLWMILVSRVKLGIATATVGGGFYWLMAIGAWLVYGERLTIWQWVGIILLSAGVVMISSGRA